MSDDDYFSEPPGSDRGRGAVSERARADHRRADPSSAVVNVPRPRAPVDASREADLPSANHLGENHLGENRLRGKLVDRLTLMAVRHCRHRAELGGTRRAIASHALGFFYADTEASGDVAVVIATRAFFYSDETENLSWVLDTLTQRASEYPPELLNVRVHLCNRVDDMSPAATLLGVGVTTVGELPSAVEDLGYSALGMNRPYRGVAQMVDGTVLNVSCGGGFLAPVAVRSTHTLNVRGQRIRQWDWMPREHVHSETGGLMDIVSRLSTLLSLAAGTLPPLADRQPTQTTVAYTATRREGRRQRVTGIRLGSDRAR
jgi:hypothetical protein